MNDVGLEDKMTLHSAQKIHFVNRVDENNAGDWNCCPLNYFYGFFKQYNVIRHDIDHVRWNEVGKEDIVIVGGSGMLYVEDSFNQNLGRLFDTGVPVIGWSIGFNTHHSRPIVVPLDVSRFTMIGIRDYNHDSGLPYLPCVSCLSPELSKCIPVCRRVGIIEHKESPIEGFGFEKMSHSDSLERITDFIASSEIILTSSYHMLYFSMLMGKKSICYAPFSTKFNYFKYPPVFYSGDLEADIASSQVYDGILEEAVSLNKEFAFRVKEIVSSRIKIQDNNYAQVYHLSREALAVRELDLLKEDFRRAEVGIRQVHKGFTSELARSKKEILLYVEERCDEMRSVQTRIEAQLIAIEDRIGQRLDDISLKPDQMENWNCMETNPHAVKNGLESVCCDELGRVLVIGDQIQLCCPKGSKNSDYFYMHYDNVEEGIKQCKVRVAELLESHKRGKAGACDGCSQLKMGQRPEPSEEMSILIGQGFKDDLCNLECIYCWVHDDLKVKRATLNKELMDVVVNLTEIYSNTLLQINFCNGEFLARKDAEDILTFLSKKNIVVSLTTNATIYSKSFAELSRLNKAGAISVSLDSGTEETYRTIKKRNLFGVVVKNLERYANLGIIIDLNYIIIPEINDNDVDFRKFCEIAKRVNARLVRISANQAAKNMPLPRKTLEKTLELYHIAKKMGLDVSCLHACFNPDDAEAIQLATNSSRDFSADKNPVSPVLSELCNDNGILLKKDVFNNFQDQHGSSLLSFSQHGQDKIVEAIFRKIGIVHPTYLDVGCNNPIEISNTALFYRSGSRGVVIDADASHKESWERLRPEDVFVHAAVTSSGGGKDIPFYIYNERSGRNSTCINAMDEFIKEMKVSNPESEISKTVSVRTFTLNEIVDTYRGGIFPDFLSIDVEGIDYAVLESVDFTKSHPKVICVELGKDASKGVDLFKRKGFHPILFTGSDIIAVHANYYHHVTLQGATNQAQRDYTLDIVPDNPDAMNIYKEIIDRVVKKPHKFFIDFYPASISEFNLYPEVRLIVSEDNRHRGNAISNFPCDFSRIFSMVLNLTRLNKDGVSGDFAELGVLYGSTSKYLAYYASLQGRSMHLFDTFSGFPKKDLVGIDMDQGAQFQENDLENVKRYVGHEDVCHYYPGYFPDTLTDDVMSKKFAFVSLDCDLFKPTIAGLDFFWPRLSPGGLIFVHDYSSNFFPGCKRAVDEFLERTSLNGILLPDLAGSIVLLK